MECQDSGNREETETKNKDNKTQAVKRNKKDKL